MRPRYVHLIETQRRDLALARALAALPQPELPDDMDARLRAALEKEQRRRRRRPGWRELLALLVVVGAVAGTIGWRYLPPSSSTMAQLETAVEMRRNALIPMPPQSAVARGRMTEAERARLERQVAADIAACYTPRFALELIVEHDAAAEAVAASAHQLAAGAEWPAPVTRQPSELVFVRRDWDGSIVVGLEQPQFDKVGASADLYTFRRLDGRWLIDDIDHRGG